MPICETQEALHTTFHSKLLSVKLKSNILIFFLHGYFNELEYNQLQLERKYCKIGIDENTFTILYKDRLTDYRQERIKGNNYINFIERWIKKE